LGEALKSRSSWPNTSAVSIARVETEDFLGRHHVPLAVIDEADLEREAALFGSEENNKA